MSNEIAGGGLYAVGEAIEEAVSAVEVPDDRPRAMFRLYVEAATGIATEYYSYDGGRPDEQIRRDIDTLGNLARNIDVVVDEEGYGLYEQSDEVFNRQMEEAHDLLDQAADELNEDG